MCYPPGRMAGNPLDAAALARLRQLVEAMHTRETAGLPMEALVRLSQEVRLPGGLTIDFDAAHTLGQPLVVLRVPESPAPPAHFSSLTPREAEIASLIAQGLRNKEIAARLFISLATVKDHVHRILEKTGLSSRAAVAAAWRGQPTP